MGVLISTLRPEEGIALSGQPVDSQTDPSAVLLAYVYVYDQRGGGVETAIKGDKQGLGVTKRHTKRFEAPQLVTQLHALAHHTMVWARPWLSPSVPRIRQWGIMRMVRGYPLKAGHPLEGSCQEGKHPPYTPFCIFC